VGRSDLLVNMDYLDEADRSRYPEAPKNKLVI